MSDLIGIDTGGLARLNKIGGSAFVMKMIDLFLKETPDRVRAAVEGQKTGNLNAVNAAVHSLKSSARNFGADRLATLAEKIETLTSPSSCENVDSLIIDLEQVYNATKAWLEHERSLLDEKNRPG